MLSSRQVAAQPASRGVHSNDYRHFEHAVARPVAANARSRPQPAAPNEELDPSVVRSSRATLDSTSRRRARRSPTAAPAGLDKQAQEVLKLTVKVEVLDGCVGGVGARGVGAS
jgi:hypothetical protein